jgi:DAACS family dicarboxylate/amino acid:cation (Na+ or H+) symporter
MTNGTPALIARSTVLLALGLPAEAVAPVAGVDVFLDMGRTAVNVFGNTLSVLVVRRLTDTGVGEPVAARNLPQHT